MASKEQIIELIADQLNTDPLKINLDATFDELGADSLVTMELLLAFETEFGIKISDEEAAQFTTVGSAVDYVLDKMKD